MATNMAKYCFFVFLFIIYLCGISAAVDPVTSDENMSLKDIDEELVKNKDTCSDGTDCSVSKENTLSVESMVEEEPNQKTISTEEKEISFSEQHGDKVELNNGADIPASSSDKSAIEDYNDANPKDIAKDETETNENLNNNVASTLNEEEFGGIDKVIEIQDTDVKTEKSKSSNSSVMYEWFKYFADSFLEEFKDGSIQKQSEKENKTNTSDISIELNETLALNISNTTTLNEITVINETSIQNVTEIGKKVKFECIGRNVTDNVNATVKIITSAKLLQLLSFDKNDTENITDCIVVMFYAPWCKFCAKTAPHYNALPRAFPQLDFVAVDTAQFSNILARFGTVSVPNVLVFHQSRSTVKFNQTERRYQNLVSFLQNATGLEPNISVTLIEEDYIGPVPSVPTDDPDYLLLLSWVFVIFCSSCMFIKSTKGQQCITRVRVLWQEHQHID